MVESEITEVVKTSFRIEKQVHLDFKKECAGDSELNMNSEINKMIREWLAERGVKSY